MRQINIKSIIKIAAIVPLWYREKIVIVRIRHTSQSPSMY